MFRFETCQLKPGIRLLIFSEGCLKRQVLSACVSFNLVKDKEKERESDVGRANE